MRYVLYPVVLDEANRVDENNMNVPVSAAMFDLHVGLKRKNKKTTSGPQLEHLAYWSRPGHRCDGMAPDKIFPYRLTSTLKTTVCTGTLSSKGLFEGLCHC